MNSHRPSLLLMVAFAAGCVAARILVIPPAGAQTVQRWEHFCTVLEPNGFTGNANLAADLQTIGTRAGREGWELVLLQMPFVCFKRPAQ